MLHNKLYPVILSFSLYNIKTNISYTTYYNIIISKLSTFTQKCELLYGKWDSTNRQILNSLIK